MNWYALHVRSSQEHVVALKLAQADLEAFYPHVLVKSRDGKRSIERKFMPGYVFSRFALEEDTPVIAISQVVGIVGAGRHAITIPESEIQAVRAIVKFPEIVSPCSFLAAGDRVRVKYGPLRGLEGYVLHWKKKAWVVVSLTSVERSMRVEVDPESLERIVAKAA